MVYLNRYSALANRVNESDAELVFSLSVPLYETLKQVQGDHFKICQKSSSLER